MNIGLVGSGPAAESIRAACADIDATVSETTPDSLGSFDLGFVVAAAGSDAFDAADEAASRWFAVEIGGVGGHPVDDLDAAVSAFDPASADFADLRARVASTTESEGRPGGDRAAVRLAGAVAGRRGIALLSGDDVAGTVVEVPGPERSFLPAPSPMERDRALDRDFRAVELDDALARAESAVDDRVGIVTQVGERESFPLPYYVAQTADTTVYADARAAELAGGAAAGWDEAYMKALGEALERYSAGVYRSSEFAVAPAASRPAAVPPSRFVRPDSFRDPDPEEPIQWVEGEDLATDSTVSLPAEFVHYPPPSERHKPSITTGLGLGNSGTEAILSGLYEVVERDATMLAWYSTFDPLGLDVTDETFETLAARARSESLEVTALLVTQDVDVPVVAVAVHRDGEWPKFAMGSGADLDANRAARSALAEALQNWTELRGMGPEQAATQGGAIATYADFPKPARTFVSPDATIPADSVGPDEVPEGAAELDAVVSAVTDADLDAYAARTTPRDVERLGFEAVRVVVPAAQPLFIGEPYFADRAESVPRDLGFEPRLDREFHPFP
ncbi:bacteriocin biosynthesis protein SagD [Haloferax sp. Atlit-10N]|uniref:YcaO-like family protein n=1 Tax=unclassified Haloferax TaxID=2625095 RepID=UPI000E22CB27|nr:MULTISPECIES: YcaO-like family protein [unclassified Haloferax]RDZ44067.1 bacteriocin biosynthesis protein SagD [Haloferax sp. Atlit-16N]RDZ47555.1 bacteriocin biosynthesis protein SagD [Haloferax sp. Atlit-19N]RDZ58111.1 bacteriocin biosynthesis protein SagD [Haloferax sp. Atlit-10N]